MKIERGFTCSQVTPIRGIRIVMRITALLLLLVAGAAAGSASNRTYAAGDLILAPDEIILDPWYSGDSQDCIRNVTLLKEGYMLSLDNLNFTSIPAKDGMWGKTIWIANFSLYKDGEVVKRSYLTHGDIIKEINLTYNNIFYYNKTIDGKEYTIIEAKLDAIFLTESCGTVWVILRPFNQYSDGTGDGEPISAATGNSARRTSEGGNAGSTYISDVYASPIPTQTAIPIVTGPKVAGFEFALAITILLVAFLCRIKRR